MLRKSWAAVLALLVAATAPAYGQIKLEWKFKEGDKFYVEDKSKMKQKIGLQGQTFDQTVVTTMVTSYEVQKVAGDTVQLKQKFEDVTVTSQGGIGGGDMDKFMEKLKGANFTMTLKGNKVTKFDGFDAFIKELSGNDEQNAKFLKMILTEEIVRQNAEEAFGFLPEKPVKTSDTWKRDTTIPLGPLGMFKTSNTYTYEGKAKDGEQIELKSSMAFTPPRGDAGGLGGLFKITKGNLQADNARGSMVFDAEQGRMVRYNMVINFKGSLTLEVGGNQIEMDIHAEQITDSRVLNRNPKGP